MRPTSDTVPGIRLPTASGSTGCDDAIARSRVDGEGIRSSVSRKHRVRTAGVTALIPGSVLGRCSRVTCVGTVPPWVERLNPLPAETLSRDAAVVEFVVLAAPGRPVIDDRTDPARRFVLRRRDVPLPAGIPCGFDIVAAPQDLTHVSEAIGALWHRDHLICLDLGDLRAVAGWKRGIARGCGMVVHGLAAGPGAVARATARAVAELERAGFGAGFFVNAFLGPMDMRSFELEAFAQFLEAALPCRRGERIAATLGAHEGISAVVVIGFA